MKYSVLASGSRGNCTIVETSDRCLLVDLGLGPRVLARQLARLGRTTDLVTDVFITHEHSDHISGLEHFCKRNVEANIFATKGTCLSLPDTVRNRVTIISGGKPVRLGHTAVLPMAVSHDAAQPVGYRIHDNEGDLALVTDLGRFDDRLLGALTGISALVVEANHDVDMLARGPYPKHLKSRIFGPLGHLSNHQCADMVSRLVVTSGKLDITLAHISETNNSKDHLVHLANRLQAWGVQSVRLAPRRSVTGFVDLAKSAFTRGNRT